MYSDIDSKRLQNKRLLMFLLLEQPEQKTGILEEVDEVHQIVSFTKQKV
jgi:hypothetical protein